MHLPPQILNRLGESFSAVLFLLHFPRLRSKSEASSLGGTTRLPQLVVLEHQSLRATLYIDGNARLVATVHDAISLQRVTVAGERFATLGTE